MTKTTVLKNTITLRRKTETETSPAQRGKTKSMQLLRVLNSEGIIFQRQLSGPLVRWQFTA